MKGLFLLSIALLVVHVCFAQQITVLQKVKDIRLLESNREDVARLLRQEDEFPSSSQEYFSFENENIKISYATGKCSDKEQEWNVPTGVATSITITPKDSLRKESLGIDFSKFRKQLTDPQRKEIYVLYDKTKGIAVGIFGDRVDAIYLFPTSKEYSRLCDNAEIKKYYASKRWTREPVPKNLIIDYNSPANVVGVTLAPLASDPRKFDVVVDAVDPENDILTYNYRVSAGQIIGVGRSVLWDLTEVAPGTYKLTAGVDDGCGICGKYIIRTVVIK
ncbi:MAG: hypothetical protein WBD27_14525 [Pyrinomonadaceae bacterium]